MKKSGLWLITSIIIGILLQTVLFINRVEFKQNCSGKLKRAADANSIEIAKVEIETVLQYAEAKGYTHGYTSVIYKTPDEDIEFWYNNLLSCYNQLLTVNENTPELERTNILMKLRETLLDSTVNGEQSVTYPDGLYKYPHNLLWGILNWVTFLLILISALFCCDFNLIN